MNKLWTTKDGKKLKIKDMSTEHIKNTMGMLERKAINEIVHMDLPGFNGEMAQLAVDQEYSRLISMDKSEAANEFYPEYAELAKELDKREMKNKPRISLKTNITKERAKKPDINEIYSRLIGSQAAAQELINTFEYNLFTDIKDLVHNRVVSLQGDIESLFEDLNELIEPK